MPLGYHTSEYTRDNDGGRAQPGDYDFRVDTAEEVTFRSGNKGLRLVLLVAAFRSKDIQVYCNLVYTPASNWRIDQFLASIGFDFFQPPEVVDLLGRYGRAKFRLGERGYLEVEEFYPAKASQAKSAPAQTPSMGSGKYDYGPPPMSMDPNDVPF